MDSEKVKAGVEVAVATDVVNSGERLPAEKLVTVPLLLPPVNVQVVPVQLTPVPVNVKAPVTVLMLDTPPVLIVAQYEPAPLDINTCPVVP